MKPHEIDVAIGVWYRQKNAEFNPYLPFWTNDRIQREFDEMANQRAIDHLKAHDPKLTDLSEYEWMLTCVECGSEVYGEHFKECINYKETGMGL